jgi:hypothetical protein
MKRPITLVLVFFMLLSAGACAGSKKIIVINDKRCKECDVKPLMQKLATIIPGVDYKEIDYNDAKGKSLYEDLKLDLLPAILLPESLKSNPGFVKVAQFTEPKGKYNVLRIGANFDPKAEICDNKIDDNGDGKTDCDDPTCKSNFKCLQKLDKSVVEAFVMSHCPFGTQIEKGLLPVWKTLKDKADISVKFCSYAMHGKKELDEEVRQYCIQKEGKAGYMAYLECFLGKKEGSPEEAKACVAKAKINGAKLSACISKTDKDFEVSKIFSDHSKWMGNFPTFKIYASENEKYGVQGSPTLVVNGVKAESGRSSAALLNTICVGFKNPPKECTEAKLSDKNPSPGFGWKEGENAPAASCGGK